MMNPSGHDESSGYLETWDSQWQEILGHVSSLRELGLLSVEPFLLVCLWEASCTEDAKSAQLPLGSS